MLRLSDFVFKGFSFKVKGIEKHELFSADSCIVLNISNSNNFSQKIKVAYKQTKYISAQKGIMLFDRYELESFNFEIAEQSFFDMQLSFKEQVPTISNGDRFEIKIKNLVHLFLIYSSKDWFIVDYIDCFDEFNKHIEHLKNNVERFETIENKLGINIQNISIRATSFSERDNRINLFFELLSCDDNLKKSMQIGVIAYDKLGQVITMVNKQVLKSRFMGFMVLDYELILNTVSIFEVDKIRILPQ